MVFSWPFTAISTVLLFGDLRFTNFRSEHNCSISLAIYQSLVAECGSKDTDGGSNYFNIFDFSSADLLLEIWRSQRRGEFSAIQRWRAELEIDSQNGGLIMDDWSEA